MSTHSNSILQIVDGIGVFTLLASVLNFILWNKNEVKADITVYKKVSCQCCARWVAHLRDNNLQVKVINVQQTSPIQNELGIPSLLSSCHTAVAGNYIIEEHISVDLIYRLLNEQPDARGLSVPGMPIGSPEMEGAEPEEYDVLLFDEQGNTSVYATRIREK